MAPGPPTGGGVAARRRPGFCAAAAVAALGKQSERYLPAGEAARTLIPLDARRSTRNAVAAARRRIADERIDHYKAPRQPAEAWAAPSLVAAPREHLGSRRPRRLVGLQSDNR